MDSKLKSGIRHLSTRLRSASRAGFAVARDPALAWVPPGHFYSPIPPAADRERAITGAQQTTRAASETFLGLDLNSATEDDLLARFVGNLSHLQLNVSRSDGRRYYSENDFFGIGDATFYACMLMEFGPRRVIEVGCGYSSALLLDVCEHLLPHPPKISLIEPFPAVLRSLCSPADLDGRLLESRVQEVALSEFSSLEAGDILFIDSTHVSRAGSDVNYLLFDVLPVLAPGVIVHFHDIFFPFEYPAQFVRAGRAWNELYLLRAFLTFNSAYEVLLFNSRAAWRRPDWYAEHLVDGLGKPGGGIWLRRQ